MDEKIPSKLELPSELTNVSSLPTLGALLFHWTVIAASIGLATAYPSYLSYFFAVLVVGTRQHALFMVMHEGVHFLISKNHRWNDIACNGLAAWPVGVSTERYRIRHWLHHRYLNTDKDPDWARKKGDPSWSFPMSKVQFLKTTLPYLFGKGIVEMFYALRAFGVPAKDLRLALPYYGIIALSISALGGWKEFALYWFIPYVSINPLLHRFRYSSEHMALPWTHLLNSGRNILCSAVENFLFSPMNSSMHLTHHIYPHIPWYQLKKAHQYLHQNSTFHRDAYEVDAYFPTRKRNVFKELTSEKQPIIQNSEKRAA